MERTVKSKIVEYKDFKIDEFEQIRIANEIICEALNLPDDFYIKDGNVMYVVEHHGSHSWFEKETLRPATEEDIAAYTVIKALYTYKKDLK